jgi:hypothetical protein
MSETLKFFDDKSPEQIINWMLENLSEEQIRLCLDQSGLPPSLGDPPPEPVVSLFEGLQVSEQSGAGPSSSGAGPSSSGAGPSSSGAGPSEVVIDVSEQVVPIVPIVKKRETLQDKFLKKYRIRCANSPFLVEKVIGKIVHFWVFDNREKKWEKSEEPIEEFKDHCNEADERRLRKAKRADLLNMPPEARAVINDYISSGLQPPIDLETETAPDQQLNANVLKGLEAQFNLAKWISEDHPILTENNITIPPLFIYGSTDTAVKHLTVVADDGELSLVDDTTKIDKLDRNFRGVTEELRESIDENEYSITPNSISQIQVLLDSQPQEIREQLRIIYKSGANPGLTLFGKKQSGPERRCALSDKSISEIEREARKKRGAAYVRNVKPKIITNALGVKTVTWVKR